MICRSLQWTEVDCLFSRMARCLYRQKVVGVYNGSGERSMVVNCCETVTVNHYSRTTVHDIRDSPVRLYTTGGAFSDCAGTSLGIDNNQYKSTRVRCAPLFFNGILKPFCSQTTW